MNSSYRSTVKTVLTKNRIRAYHDSAHIKGISELALVSPDKGNIEYNGSEGEDQRDHDCRQRQVVDVVNAQEADTSGEYQGRLEWISMGFNGAAWRQLCGVVPIESSNSIRK